VVNQGSGTVTPIRTAANTAAAPIPVGQGPDAVVITPNGKTVYVASVGMGSVGSVTAVRTAAGQAAKAIPVGDSPDALAVTENGKTLYVVNFTNGPGTARGSVTPIRTTANKAARRS
jgi:hyaluronoglucosaminidase